MMRAGLPNARPGQVVGLLGGSFDPPHEGHAHISRTALRRFGLDQVWWLVSPGNPLKTRGPAALDVRLRAAEALLHHPKIKVSGVEAQLGTRYTADTIAALQALYPDVRFVWLMGADNLGQFHLWQDWEDIMNRVPIGVLARPGQRISARMSKAARVYRANRLMARASVMLGQREAPAWCFVNLPMTDASSTAIRESGAWK